MAGEGAIRRSLVDEASKVRFISRQEKGTRIMMC